MFPSKEDDSPLEEPDDDVIVVPCAAPYESCCTPETELEEGPDEDDWGPVYPDDAEVAGVFEDWGPVYPDDAGDAGVFEKDC